VRRLLVLRALGLGDLLTVVPALRALRTRFADAEIWLAAPPALAPLVRRTGAVDRLLPVRSAVRTPPTGPPPWRGPPPDLAVNLHGQGPQSVAALRALTPGELWSYSIEGAPPWRDDEHEVRRWCRLVSGHGCPADPTDLRLGAWRGSRGPYLLHPGAASAERRWPARRFAEVGRELAGRGHRVVVTGGPDERDLAERVARGAGLPAGSVLAGRTDLAELADLVAGARAVICGDTGVAHLASAYGTPSVVLFGPQPPSRWGPPGDGPHTVLRHPSLKITVAEVVSAALERASRRPASAARSRR